MTRIDPKRKAFFGRPLTDSTGHRSAAHLRRLAGYVAGWHRALALDLAERAEVRDRLHAAMGGDVGVKVHAVHPPVQSGAARRGAGRRRAA